MTLDAQVAPEGAPHDLAALSRQVSADPSDPVARIRLAMALLQSGASDRAGFHLLQARAAPLTETERLQLDALSARIAARRNHEGWLSFAIVPETNPAQRTDADTIWIGDLPFRLNPDARARRTTGVHVNAGGAVMPRIGEGLRLRVGGSLAARLYEDRALQDITLRAELGLQGQTTAGHDWQITGSTARRSLGGSHFGQGVGMHLAWTQRLGRASVLRLRAETVDWRFRDHPALDGPRLAVSLDLRHALRPDTLLSGSVSLSRVDARAPHEAGQSLRVGLGAQHGFPGGLVLGVESYTESNRRDGRDPIFGILRRDHQSGLTLRLMHRNVALGNFAPVIELSSTRQTSNSPLHAWHNTRASFSLSRLF